MPTAQKYSVKSYSIIKDTKCPFGMLERSYSNSTYRFGFNGKENDNEILGNGRWQDYGQRLYRPDLIRFFTPDPLIVYQKKYPELSSYQFASNMPIMAIDMDGLEELPSEIYEYAKKAGKSVVKKTTQYLIGKIIETTLSYFDQKIDEKISEEKQQEIGLTFEFITGTGPEVRVFNEQEPITQSLKQSNLTTEALKAFYKGYQEYIAGNREKPPSEYRVDFSYFYPLDGDTGPFKEYATDGWSAAQFTGTAYYSFSVDEKNNVLNIIVYDTKTEYSFLYHMFGDRHKREENPIMGETIQYYVFSIPLDEVEKRVKSSSESDEK